MQHEQILKEIQQYIEDNCIFRADPDVQYSMAAPKGKLVSNNLIHPLSWLMMMRRLTHNPKMLFFVAALIADDIVEKMRSGKEYQQVQLAGLETSSIPLMTAIQMVMIREGIAINAFTVRKQRKHYGLFNLIDGMPTDAPVIVVDDIINTGSSVSAVLDVCTKELKLIPAKNCYAIVAFRHMPIIKYEEHYIDVVPLFSKNQFTLNFDKDKYWLPKDCIKHYDYVEQQGVNNDPRDIILVDRKIQTKKG